MGRVVVAIIVASCALCLTQLAVAAKVEYLYRASFPVQSQNVAEREKMAAAGLARVLVKVSGQRQLPEDGSLRLALTQASRYMQQFSYSPGEGGYLLHLDYAKSAVDGVLRKSGLPIWPENRPQILLWLAEDDFQQRQLLATAELPELVAAITEFSAGRGVSIDLPIMDLDDRVALSLEAAWSLNEQALDSASLRYQSDATLLGRMSLTGSGQWRASWLLRDNDTIRLFDSSGADRAAVLDEGLGQVVDFLASQHAIVASPVGLRPEYMVLNDIGDFKAYREVLSYLNGLAMIRHAEPETITGGQLRLRLYIDGQLQQLIDAMALDKTLLPAQAQIGSNLPSGTLLYRLKPELEADNVIEPLPVQELPQEGAAAPGA